LFDFAATAAGGTAVGNFPTQEGFDIGMACLVFDFFDEGEADVTTDLANLFVVD
jgi:hypothetical protein